MFMGSLNNENDNSTIHGYWDELLYVKWKKLIFNRIASDDMCQINVKCHFVDLLEMIIIKKNFQKILNC